jgi:putative serine protease PepD
MRHPPLPNRTGSSIFARTRAGFVGALVLAAALVVACSPAASTPSSTPSAVPSAAPSATAAAADALQSDFVDVVNRVSPSVVVVETARGLGSGVVFDTKGDIITNNHVVDGSSRFAVTLADGRKLDGTLVGTYPAGDLAVVHVTDGNLQPASFADSSKLAVGDIVLALGSPLGLQSSVTQGIISALGRSVPESASITLPDVIQTSAEINPGNSGGALVDLSGRVVGIPTLAALDPELGDTQAAGIGFAIPSDTVQSVADHLIASGT